MLKNDFIVKINKSSLVLKADVDTLRDIAVVLSHLVDMVHVLKNRAEIVYARDQRKQRSRQVKVNRDNRERSLEIFKRYLKHLNNGCEGNQTKARKVTAEEYNLQCVDAKFFITEGRKLMKEEEKKRQTVLF